MRVPTPTARAVHGLFNAFKIVCFAICRSIPPHTDEIPFASKFTAVLVPSIALDAFLYVRKAVTTAPTAGANHLKFFSIPSKSLRAGGSSLFASSKKIPATLPKTLEKPCSEPLLFKVSKNFFTCGITSSASGSDKLVLNSLFSCSNSCSKPEYCTSLISSRLFLVDVISPLVSLRAFIASAPKSSHIVPKRSTPA